ncbi:acyl-CoA (8-3)-desaturase-like, partial [Thamnophis elegans]|uniref:acyl-CoA (8-3)-desaturase-like n=1 Tax=Thamnophis elegans TaxID=35005 RepID=UPI0013786C1A
MQPQSPEKMVYLDHFQSEIINRRFWELLSTVEKMGLFKPNQFFFFLILLHILLMDAAGWFVLWYFGISKTSFLIATVLLTFAQSQAGFLQHDLGHHSVFSNPKWNHLWHEFVMCYLKGGSANWWSLHHSQHHAKPNCFEKDPDVSFHPYILSLGETLSLELGLQKKKYMPYNYQHKSFSPPTSSLPLIVLPIIQVYTFYFIFQRKLWREIAWILAYFIRFFIAFNAIFGFGFKGVLGYLFLLRVLESIIFIWISQTNHLPMPIDHDKNMDWFSTQLQSTCNVNQSFFNDWVTGHLNFQIEHHLFPT